MNIIFHGIPTEESIWNPTNHTYFNLTGKPQSIRSQKLYLNAIGKVNLNNEKIPTGEVERLDSLFQKENLTLEGLLQHYPQWLDDCFLLNSKDEKEIKLLLSDRESGRQLKIKTNRDAIILFTGTGMTSNCRVNGTPLLSEQGLAIECQEVPDAHYNHLSKIEYKANESLYKWTNYQFSIYNEE